MLDISKTVTGQWPLTFVLRPNSILAISVEPFLISVSGGQIF